MLCTACSILLVEDDDAHAEIVQRNLSGLPFTATLLRMPDGQAALDYLLGHDDAGVEPHPSLPDLILLDLRLPRLDGIEVLTRIKNTPHLATIPVVVLTTSAAERDIAAAYDARANSYLVKPVSLPEFANLLTSLAGYWLNRNETPRLRTPYYSHE